MSVSNAKVEQVAQEKLFASLFCDAVKQSGEKVETRRRLEDVMEERRLKREMEEYDFEFED